MTGSEMTRIAPALKAEFPAILSLLEESDLPTAGVSRHVGTFFVARRGDRLLGCIGLEVYGEVGLLRSLAVRAEARGNGLGRVLVERLLTSARKQELETIYLLTTTADRYFPRFGFEPADREEADERLRSSEEFRGACPDTAVCMRLKM